MIGILYLVFGAVLRWYLCVGSASTWDFGELCEDVDVMTCSELFSYLTTDLKFATDDMKELESKLNYSWRLKNDLAKFTCPIFRLGKLEVPIIMYSFVVSLSPISSMVN